MDYGLRPAGIGWSRQLFELLLSTLFRWCAHPLARWLADATPTWVIGPSFQWFRTVWKAATKQVKKTGLLSPGLRKAKRELREPVFPGETVGTSPIASSTSIKSCPKAEEGMFMNDRLAAREEVT